jgi:hypothetical protein
MHGFRRIAASAAAAAALVLGTACASTISGAASYGQAKCEGETIKPSGSPYCYIIPGGFQQVSGAYLGNDKWVTGVGLDNSNVILTGVLINSKDADTLSDDELLKETDAYVSGAIGSVKLKSDKGVLGRIPAGRSVEYRGSFEQGGDTVTLHFYYIYMGHSVLQLNCQSTDKTDEVEKACADVLPTIHLTSAKAPK